VVENESFYQAHLKESNALADRTPEGYFRVPIDLKLATFRIKIQ
jgi:hypothetical protein